MTLEATLDATVDDDVEFAFHVVNVGSTPVELTFPSGQIADVTVYADAPEDPLWRWSDDRMFTQAIMTKTLAPSKTLEQVYTWEDPPAGEYVAKARLEADKRVEAETAVSIGP